MFKPISFVGVLGLVAASIALETSIATKPANAGFGIGIGTGFGLGRRSSIGFGASFGSRSSFGVGATFGRPYGYGAPYRNYNPYRGNRVLIQRPYYPYYPGAVYPNGYQAPTVIVVPNGAIPRSACGTAIYGSPIASPIPVDPYTGLACR